jgi:SAM-dependent methyltransferase
VDVILSNCVINLSPDKPQVFREAFRVLKSGGRLAISDVVATAELPPEWRDDPRLHSGCMAGAARIADLEAMLATAGFTRIAIQPKDQSREFIRDWAPGGGWRTIWWRPPSRPSSLWQPLLPNATEFLGSRARGGQAANGEPPDSAPLPTGPEGP